MGTTITLAVIYLICLPLALYMLPNVIREFGVRSSTIFTFLSVWLIMPLFLIHYFIKKMF